MRGCGWGGDSLFFFPVPLAFAPPPAGSRRPSSSSFFSGHACCSVFFPCAPLPCVLAFFLAPASLGGGFYGIIHGALLPAPTEPDRKKTSRLCRALPATTESFSPPQTFPVPPAPSPDRLSVTLTRTTRTKHTNTRRCKRTTTTMTTTTRLRALSVGAATQRCRLRRRLLDRKKATRGGALRSRLDAGEDVQGLVGSKRLCSRQK